MKRLSFEEAKVKMVMKLKGLSRQKAIEEIARIDAVRRAAVREPSPVRAERAFSFCSGQITEIDNADRWFKGDTGSFSGDGWEM